MRVFELRRGDEKLALALRMCAIPGRARSGVDVTAFIVCDDNERVGKINDVAKKNVAVVTRCQQFFCTRLLNLRRATTLL